MTPNNTQPPEPDITADDLRRIVEVYGMVPIPEHLMPRVLAQVRSQRAAMRRFDASGLALGKVVTAQPYRVREGGEE